MLSYVEAPVAGPSAQVELHDPQGRRGGMGAGGAGRVGAHAMHPAIPFDLPNCSQLAFSLLLRAKFSQE